MSLKAGISLILLTVMGAALVGFEASHAEEDTAESTDFLIRGFANWAEALEEGTVSNSSWEFPFGAPQGADLSSQEMKTVLALRRLVRNEELEELESLANQVGRRQEEIPAQMSFWLAYAQGKLDQKQACLSNLKLLLETPEGWKNLENGQMVWVLTGTPDLLFLAGNRELAEGFYARLAASPVDQLNVWGHYQLGGMNFLDRDFEQANERYSMVCEADNPGIWREHACAMAEISEQLSRLGWKGESNGEVATANP